MKKLQLTHCRYPALLLIICLLSLNVSGQTYNDGPIELKIRVTEVRVEYDSNTTNSNDYTLQDAVGVIMTSFAPITYNIRPDEITCKVWARDNVDLDNQSWQGGDCMTGNLPMTTGGPEVFTLSAPKVIFSHKYNSQQVPQFLDLKLEAWEDDLPSDFDLIQPNNIAGILENNCNSADGFSRCVYDGTTRNCFTLFGSGTLPEQDDIHCVSDSFFLGLDYRAAGPPGQWNSHGFIAGNASANNYYQPKVESYWRYLVPVAGKITSESGSPVREVFLSASGTAPANSLSELNGIYSLGLDPGASYMVRPSKSNDQNVTNGISTIDILLIKKHLLGVNLQSPYKIIAADVNSSGSVTTADVLLVNAMVLQNIAKFPGNKLWSFVTHDFVFTDPTNPFPYDSSRYYASVSALTNQDYIGVKLGDVNNSWDPNIPKTESYAGEVILTTDCVSSTQAGQEILIPIKAKQFENISGMQFTLNWNENELDFSGIRNGSLQVDAATQKTIKGKLGVLWTDENAEPISLNEDEVLFSLRFISKSQGDCHLDLNSSFIAMEAVNADLELLEIQLLKDEPSALNESGYRVYQNVPNPFSDHTTISFELPQEKQVGIKVYDMLGKVVEKFNGTYPAGSHQIKIGNSQLARGVYYLQFETDDYRQSIKMTYIGE